MKVISVNIGERKTVTWRKKEVVTGIYKFPVEKPIFLDVEEVEGDAIVNREHHGGIAQAVYGYSAKHYPYFKALHPHLDWQYGMFGENITFDDLDEEKMTVGSTYELGESIVEVSKSRQPCYKLGIRFGDQAIVKQFWETTMCGVYFKVLKTGNVQVGDELKLIKKSEDTPSIAHVYKSKK